MSKCKDTHFSPNNFNLGIFFLLFEAVFCILFLMRSHAFYWSLGPSISNFLKPHISTLAILVNVAFMS